MRVPARRSLPLIRHRLRLHVERLAGRFTECDERDRYPRALAAGASRRGPARSRAHTSRADRATRSYPAHAPRSPDTRQGCRSAPPCTRSPQENRCNEPKEDAVRTKAGRNHS
jgi:hypothetical protein